MGNRVGGIMSLKVNGSQKDCKGSFSWNLGENKTETVSGQDRNHGYKEKVQPAVIEGMITVGPDLDIRALIRTRNATITLELSSGQILVMNDGRYAADGKGTTEEGELEVKFESDGKLEVIR
jgi:hypothetical protein